MSYLGVEIEPLLLKHSELFIYQKNDWVEILVGWETANKYVIFDEANHKLGYIIERKKGFKGLFLHSLFGTHRPFEIDVFDHTGQCRWLKLNRAFFWLFSDVKVYRGDGYQLGSVRRRFSLFRKKYELRNASGRIFARIRTPLFSWWSFPIFDSGRKRHALIQKKWGGFLREMFTDADSYRIHFGDEAWSGDQRAVMLAAVISIDFDYFERNQARNRSGALDNIPSPNPTAGIPFP